jgi:MoaA/NifB/PqqE/SkfB family radical SAM enzyme
MSALAILYRGPLDSCNYACRYCPFAKREPSRRMLESDRDALERFVAWVRDASRWDISLLFTPYGEALIWPHYQEALTELSRMPHVRQVSIQTNASGRLGFLDDVDRARISLWISWHPTEIALEPFVERVAALHEAGVRLSVGAVAVPEHLEQVEALRALLPAALSVWINAQKPNVRYPEHERARWRAIDPAFDLDTRRHLTRGQACLTGEDTISVDGDGTITRCHFVDEVLGNLYTQELETILKPRACSRARCDCFIGYVNLPTLDLRRSFVTDGWLARMRA